MAKSKLKREQADAISNSITETLSNSPFATSDTKVNVMVSKNIPKIPNYVQVFQESILNVAFSKGMNLVAFRIFTVLIGQMGYQNFIGISIKQLSKDLETSERSIIRGLKTLKDLNIVISINSDLDARYSVYAITPLVAWKGKSINYVNHMKKMKNLKTPGQLSLPFDRE